MKNFKERLLELVKRINEIGIVEKLHQTTSADELYEVWRNFTKFNRELIKKILLWNKDYKNNCSEKLFSRGEKIENAEELALFIHFLYYKEEDNLFENKEDLRKALYELNNEFAIAVADIMEKGWILDITHVVIFETISEAKRKQNSENEQNSGTNHS